MKQFRVALTGGGTGGHIFPLLAVAQELKKQTAGVELILDMRYFGAAYAYAQEIVDNDIEFVPVLSSKLRRYWSLLNILDAFKFFLSIPQLMWKLFWFMPDVIFSKGGPGALAVVLVGRFYRIPVVIHESDSVPGLTNVLSGKIAEKIFLAFSPAAEYFRNKNIEISGNPVRQSLLDQRAMIGAEEATAKETAKKGFGFNLSDPILLVLGGSQGAEKLNDFIFENLDELLNEFQILHQVGALKFESYKKEVSFLTKDWSDMGKGRYLFRPFFEKDLADALTAADLIISRAGSGSLFEIAAFAKPSILVPLERSSKDHQKENARIYVENGAGYMISEENLLGGLMIDKIKSILGNQEVYDKMSQAAQSFYRSDSAAVIARYLTGFIS